MDKTKKQEEKQPLQLWLVDITLTSGEDLQFYVSAINQFEAYKKAEGYVDLAENESLRRYYKTIGFKFLP